MAYTIRQPARLAGVTVRTLHYCDSIGLLKPSFIKPNGYRCYEQPELIRLQQILFFKELDLPLEQIKEIMDSPGFDILDALAGHKRLIEMKLERLEGLLSTIDRTIEGLKGEWKMEIEDLYSPFSKKQIEEYRQEVRERWGEEMKGLALRLPRVESREMGDRMQVRKGDRDGQSSLPEPGVGGGGTPAGGGRVDAGDTP